MRISFPCYRPGGACPVATCKSKKQLTYPARERPAHFRDLPWICEPQQVRPRAYRNVTVAMARLTLSGAQTVTGPGAAPGAAILVP
jgi:hypothetical protein